MVRYCCQKQIYICSSVEERRRARVAEERRRGRIMPVQLAQIRWEILRWKGDIRRRVQDLQDRIKVATRTWETRSKIREHFNFYPSSKPDTKGFEQRIVDSVLTIRAIVFQRACDQQAEIQASFPLCDPKEIEKLHSWLVMATIRVEAKKGDFWEAHRIAREAGYKVQDTYKAYLRSDLLP